MKTISRLSRIQVTEKWATNGSWIFLRGFVNHLLPAEIRHVPLATFFPPNIIQASNSNASATEEIISSAEKGIKSWNPVTDSSLLIRDDGRIMRILISNKSIMMFSQDYLDLLPSWDMGKLRIDGDGLLLFLEDGKVHGVIMRCIPPEEKIRKALASMAGASFPGGD